MSVKKSINFASAAILAFLIALALLLNQRIFVSDVYGESIEIKYGDIFLFASRDDPAFDDLKNAGDFKFLFDEAQNIVGWRVAGLSAGYGIMLIPEAASDPDFNAYEFIRNIHICETEKNLLAKNIKNPDMCLVDGAYVPVLYINPEQIKNLSGDGSQASPFIDRSATGIKTTVSVETFFPETSAGGSVTAYAHVTGKNFYDVESGKVQFYINGMSYGDPTEIGEYGVAEKNISVKNPGEYEISASYAGVAEYRDSLPEDERATLLSVVAKYNFAPLSSKSGTQTSKSMTLSQIEIQVNNTKNAIHNNTKKSVSGDSYADLHSFYYNYAGSNWCSNVCRNCPSCWRKYGMCHVFTIHQLCYLDIISYDKQAALNAGVEADWGYNKLGAGGVLEAGLWTNGSRNADGSWVKSETNPVLLRNGTVMQGDYRTYGMTLKKGVTEKNRKRSGVTSITSSNVNEHIKKWEPQINAVNAIFRNYIESLPVPTYNILLEYSPVNPRDIIFGHIMFVQAKVKDENGKEWIYFIESHDRRALNASGGFPARPAQGEGWQKLTVDDFINRYSTRPNFSVNGLFVGGMCFEIAAEPSAPDIFRFKNQSAAQNGPPEILRGGLFALTANYKATPQSEPRRIIMNIKESSGTYRYEINQWAAYTFYNDGDVNQWAKTKNNDGIKQARYVFPALTNGVTIDLSTLSRNTIIGKEYRDRFTDFQIVEIEAPEGYKTPPVSSKMQGGIWIVVNEKIPVEIVEVEIGEIAE